MFMSLQDFGFPPHVGEFYGKKGSFFKKRLVILGASHYDCQPENQSETTKDGERLHDEESFNCGNGVGFTEAIIKNYLNGNMFDKDGKLQRWKNTFTKFINAMLQHDASADERKAFMGSVIFYNYLQEIEGSGPNDKHPEKFSLRECKERNELLFKMVLTDHSPEVVVVWGKRVWNNFPDDLGEGDHIKNIDDARSPNGMHDRIWDYKYNGKIIVFCASDHPSYSGYRRDNHAALYSVLNLL